MSFKNNDICIEDFFIVALNDDVYEVCYQSPCTGKVYSNMCTSIDAICDIIDNPNATKKNLNAVKKWIKKHGNVIFKL